MGQSEFRLQEWLKQVDQSAKEIKAKKTSPTDKPGGQSSPQTPASPAAGRRVRESTRRNVMSTIVAEIERVDSDEGVGEVRRREVRPQNRPVATVEPSEAKSSFLEVDESDTMDIPRVEDHIPFLDTPAQTQIRPSVIQLPPTAETLSEWVGDPRPKVREAQPKPAPVESTPKVERVRAAVPAASQPNPQSSQELQENWNRMPKHLQILFASNGQEVAQNSYKAFRESRGDLVARLLDPIISLEETARILNVCPTTVRRYTNRAMLNHFRTAGNQRRFRLSEVLSFMDKSQAEQPADS